MARFAPEVADAAREGDAAASEIWSDAAREVASTATAALGRVFDPGSFATVSWLGNLFGARDLMLDPFKRDVIGAWPPARLVAPKGTALRGAELLVPQDDVKMFGSFEGCRHAHPVDGRLSLNA